MKVDLEQLFLAAVATFLYELPNEVVFIQYIKKFASS